MGCVFFLCLWAVLQQILNVGDFTADSTARNSLEVMAVAQCFCSQLLQRDRFRSRQAHLETPSTPKSSFIYLNRWFNQNWTGNRLSRIYESCVCMAHNAQRLHHMKLYWSFKVSCVCWFFQTFLQCLATAVPSGCSLLASAVPTIARTFRRGSLARSHRTSTLVTCGTPLVMVPVLSNITAPTCRNSREESQITTDHPVNPERIWIYLSELNS